MPYIRIQREIKPRGADETAAEFAAAADALREIARAITSVETGLDQSWEGRAREFYFEEFGHLSKHLEVLSDDLERMGLAIRGRTVHVYEEVWVPAQ